MTASWRAPDRVLIELPNGRTLRCEGVPQQIASAVALLDGTHEIPAIANRLSIDESWVRWLVGVLRDADALTTRRRFPVIEIRGCADLGAAIARLLLAGPPMKILLNDPSRPLSAAHAASWTKADALQARLRDEGITPTSLGENVETARLTSQTPDIVVLAFDRSEPDRAVTDDLLRHDQAYLVMSFVGSAASVGPLVVPGRTACLRCGDLFAADADPDWPSRLASRVSRPVSLDPATLAWTAATVVHQVRGWTEHGSADALGAALELDTLDGRLRTRRWPAHPRCGCIPNY